MKHFTKALWLLIVLSLIVGSCRNDDDLVHGTDPEPPFQIQFYVIDSIGNLVFPAEGPYLSMYSPDNFSASSKFSENIGFYNSESTYGHVFRIVELTSIIIQNRAAWQNDSIIYFYPCFGNKCDTILVFNPFNAGLGAASSAEMIVWKNDTIYNFNSTMLTYELNE